MSIDITLIILGVFIIIELVIVALLFIDRENMKEINDKGFNSEEYPTGNWHGGTFYANPLLPMEEVVSNQKLNTLIKSYNLKVKIFYLIIVLAIGWMVVRYNL